MIVVIKLRESMPQGVHRIVKNGQRVNSQRIARQEKDSSNVVSGFILVFIDYLIIFSLGEIKHCATNVDFVALFPYVLVKMGPLSKSLEITKRM